MRLLFLFGTLCFLVTAALGQTSFIRTYGNTGYDYGRDIKEDNDTGYVVTGSSTSFGNDNTEAYLLKVDKNGEFQWSYNYGGSATEWGEALVVTNDSTYAIAGYTNSYGAGGFDFYLVRINEDGTPLWENYYGGSNWDRAYGMVQLPDSGFVLVGESYSFNEGLQHGYMVRTDKNGEVIWEESITEDVPTFFSDIALDGDSIVVCGGIGDGGEDSYDGYYVKYHIDGTFGWSHQVGQEHNDYFNAVYSVAGIYSFGGVRGYRFPEEKDNMWFYRTEDNGNLVIDTTYTTLAPENDGINDVIARDFDQDYYYIGYTSSFGYMLDGKHDIFLGKMTLSGITVTNRNFGEAGEDIGHAIDRSRDGGVVFLCDTRFFATGGHNIMIIKLNPYWEYPDMFADMVYDDITNSLPEYIESSEFTVYPNPTEGLITLPEMHNGKYIIYGLDGKALMAGIIASDQIDVSSLSNGVYMLTVQTEEGIYSKRIIKN